MLPRPTRTRMRAKARAGTVSLARAVDIGQPPACLDRIAKRGRRSGHRLELRAEVRAGSSEAVQLALDGDPRQRCIDQDDRDVGALGLDLEDARRFS
jgi:hypothetical protein